MLVLVCWGNSIFFFHFSRIWANFQDLQIHYLGILSLCRFILLQNHFSPSSIFQKKSSPFEKKSFSLPKKYFIRERSKFTGYLGRDLGKNLPEKKVFAPFFYSKKSRRPPYFFLKKVFAPLFLVEKKSSPPYFFFKKNSSPPFFISPKRSLT